MNLFRKYSYSSKINDLIEKSKHLGLAEKHIKDAKELLEHNESGLCLDTILENLYEYDVEIDSAFLVTLYELLGAENSDNKWYYDLSKKLKLNNKK